MERIRNKRKESYMSKLKGLWISSNILLNEELSDKEKIVLSIISYLSDETGSCFASNKYIASIVNVTSDRVSKIVSTLKKKGYIEAKLKLKTESKEVESRQIIPNKEKLNGYSERYLQGIGENNKDIINNIKNNYNKETLRKKNNKANFEQGDYTDFTKLYANADAFVQIKSATKIEKLLMRLIFQAKRCGEK